MTRAARAPARRQTEAIARVCAGILAVITGLALAPGGCRRRETAAAVVALPAPVPRSSAHPSEFVHPPIIDPPPNPEARPECSTGALAHVVARIREVQKAAATVPAPPRKPGRRAGCGSPAMAALDQQVKGDLDERVRGCVGRDGPLDAEWNSLGYSLSSLGVCLDCARPVPERKADCQRALEVVNRALTDAQAKSPQPPR